MEIKKQGKHKEQHIFTIKNIDHEFINTLRRTILAEVPTLAVKNITIKKNSSALFDEILSHRLGLIPLITDLETYELPEKCSCEAAGCAKCQLKFTLKAIGPGTIMASEMKIEDPVIKPVYENLPIVKLLDEQEIEMEGIITLGKGKQHSKYSSCLIYYKGIPKIKIKNPKNIEEIAKSCPKKLFEVKNKELKVKNQEECILCQYCAEASNSEIEITASDKEFIITIEPWGQLPPEIILKESANILSEKLTELETKFSKLK
ncbi:MAG TPA: DNA-directed RNA polymerase subunit D [Candidatus Nanoarchaeia archaeon]|nr:DNA-directed RNA polymerase subunit D [Candidatus Nanoarchaeia archaeon]